MNAYRSCAILVLVKRRHGAKGWHMACHEGSTFGGEILEKSGGVAHGLRNELNKIATQAQIVFANYHLEPAVATRIQAIIEIALKLGREVVQLEIASRRRFTRYRVEMRVKVVPRSEVNELEGRAFNLSEGGMGAILTGEVPIGDVVNIQFVDAGVELRFAAIVRWHSARMYGFEFINLREQEKAVLRNYCSKHGVVEA
jgi:hypothetical protein